MYEAFNLTSRKIIMILYWMVTEIFNLCQFFLGHAVSCYDIKPRLLLPVGSGGISFSKGSLWPFSRSTFKEQAADNAAAHGDEGYRFPWESGFSGNEVTLEGTCDGCRDRQIHNTAAVSWAIRQYFSATRDHAYMTDPDYNGCDMTREIARFFANRAIYNNETERYDITGECRLWYIFNLLFNANTWEIFSCGK